jgi:hypothetical protein
MMKNQLFILVLLIIPTLLFGAKNYNANKNRAKSIKVKSIKSALKNRRVNRNQTRNRAESDDCVKTAVSDHNICKQLCQCGNGEETGACYHYRCPGTASTVICGVCSPSNAEVQSTQ